MANLSALGTRQAIADANLAKLKKDLGLSSNQFKSLGASTLIGADIVEGYQDYANAKIQEDNLEQTQQEIQSRSDATIASIFAQQDKVQAAQTTSFIKAGVKLEGSALNVLQETAQDALDAAKIQQREADFDIKRMEVAKAIARTKAKYAPYNTALSALGSGALAFS